MKAIKKSVVIVCILTIIISLSCCLISCGTDTLESFYEKFKNADSLRIDFTTNNKLLSTSQINRLSYEGNKAYTMLDGEEVFYELETNQQYVYYVMGGKWGKDINNCDDKTTSRQKLQASVEQLLNEQNYLYDKKTKQYNSVEGVIIYALEMNLSNVCLWFDKLGCHVTASMSLAEGSCDVEISILDINNVEIVLPTIQ